MAEKLTCVRSNVTQLVDRVEADGLVKRTDDPADRRAVRAEVTALGRKRRAAGNPVVDAVLRDVGKKLSAVDSRVLKRALDAIQWVFLAPWFMYESYTTDRQTEGSFGEEGRLERDSSSW